MISLIGFLVVNCIFRHRSLLVCNTSAEVKLTKDYSNGKYGVYFNKSLIAVSLSPFVKRI